MVKVLFPVIHFVRSQRALFKSPIVSSLYQKNEKSIVLPELAIIAYFSNSNKLSVGDEPKNVENCSNVDEKALFEQDLLSDDIKRMYRHSDSAHNLYLIQPRKKFGSGMVSKSMAELKIAEAAALVKTLKGWKVKEQSIISVHCLGGKFIFGKGNLEVLKSKIRGDSSITGVFIAVDMLTALQNAELERVFRVPIFDRYQIVLRIFHDHARTKVSRLQIALAEIPYLKVKLAGFSYTGQYFEEIGHCGGSGETYMEMRKRLLFEREQKLKNALQKVENHRQFLRKSDYRNSLPIIAVVGYTNCGKTTLIKSLTSDTTLVPEDKLFATLDVTLHTGLLPSSQKILYVDTVGFISDVPTTLIQSFKSTLEDALSADLIIHIRDISHPDTDRQKKLVLQTLQELQLPQKLLDSIIEVGNKVDLLENFDKSTMDENMILISATEGTNLLALSEAIEDAVLSNTGRGIQLFRVSNGGEEYQWLRKNAAIRDSRVEEDMNYVIVEVIISDECLSKFKHYFGDLSISVDEIMNKGL